jgi:hypothetical protein
VMSGAVHAQTTGALNPNPAPAAEPSTKEDVPPGGCMPIGLTASGEIVFPIQCKEFIEREREKAVEQKPPTAEAPLAATQPQAVAPPKTVAPKNTKPPAKPIEAVALPKRVEHHPREPAMGSEGCSHYRSYDPASGTYRNYDGRRRTCDER